MENNMNKTLMWIIIAVVILGLGYYIYRANSDDTLSQETTQSELGKLTVAFTDAAASIKNVNEISMEVEKVEVYSDTQGWVEVGSQSRTYKLLDLNKRKEAEIYTTADVDADTYTRARVTLGDVKITTKSGEKIATLPRNEMDMEAKVVVGANKSSGLTLDFLADKSLYLTSKGDYVFAPVVAIEGRSQTEMSASDNGVVTFNGGSIDTNQNVGMDVDGTVRNDFQIGSNVKLDVNAGTVLDLNASANTNTNTNTNTNSGTNLNTSTEGSGTFNLDGVLNY